MRTRNWTDKEMSLLGIVGDRELAERLGRTEQAVLFKRRELGIAAHKPHARKWSKRELKMLGKMSDAAIAEKLGVSRKHVAEVRGRLGIACANPRNRPTNVHRSA